MIRHLVLGALLMSLASCGTSAAESASSTSSSSVAGQPQGIPCGPASARTLAQSSSVRVYSAGRNVFGCAAGSGKSRRLGQTSSCLGGPRVGPVDVAGTVAAYGLERCGVDTGESQVVVRRLTDGKVLRNNRSITRTVGVEAYQSVTSLVVRGDGAVAWIAVVNSIGPHHKGVEVHRADKRGRAVLEVGRGIDPRSLRLNRTTLSWVDSGGRRTATLR